MSSSLSALEERSLLASLGAPTDAERRSTLLCYARANSIAGAALSKADRAAHPPPSALDRLAPPLRHGVLPGLTLGASSGAAAEAIPALARVGAVNPLQLTAAERLLLRSAHAAKQPPAAIDPTAAAALRSLSDGVAIAAASAATGSPTAATPASVHSSPGGGGRKARAWRVPSYRVDPDIVRGSARRFQEQLFPLLWGECPSVVSDTEGVHPLFSGTKQAQDLFADLHVADVLLYGRTGVMELPAASAASVAGSAVQSARTSALSSPLRSTRSVLGSPPAVHSVPCAPMQWYFMQTNHMSNEKKLCRKVEFDHRHVVPEFENREAETPILPSSSNAPASPATHSSPLPTNGKAAAAPATKGLVKTCDIICERFRFDQGEDDEMLATQAEQAEASASLQPLFSNPDTGPGSPHLSGSGDGSNPHGTVFRNRMPRGSILMQRVAAAAVAAGRAPPVVEEKDASASPPSALPMVVTVDTREEAEHDRGNKTRVAAAASPTNGARGSIYSHRSSIGGVGISAGAAASGATPGPSALQTFQHRMTIHGRTDPTQTKLDKQYFNKDNLRTFLRSPYGRGALLKFVLSRGTNCELIRATWVDKGPMDAAAEKARHRRGNRSNLYVPPATPPAVARSSSSSSSAPPYAGRYIKFLVQTRTNSFRLNDHGFSFYERTLTYPHPNDHRVLMHDLENEYNLDAELLHGVQNRAEYLKQRRRDREKEAKRVAKEMEREERRQWKQGKGVLGGSSNVASATTAAASPSRSTTPNPDAPQDDASSLQAQRNNQHYRIQNYEAGSPLYEQLRAVCDKLAAYFDLVLASGPEHEAGKRTKKMQLYFRRDPCGQLWLLWSDCLEFHDPEGSKHPRAASGSAKSSTRSTMPASTALRTAAPLSSSFLSPESALRSLAALKIDERRETPAAAEEDEYGDEAFSDCDDATDDDESEEEEEEEDELEPEADRGSSDDTDSADERENGRPSWRATNRRKNYSSVETTVTAATAVAKTFVCAHCRTTVPKSDIYFVLLHTLLHTYQLENPSKGFFHQRKMEWSHLQWQAAPESLAEAKEEARKEQSRSGALSRRMSVTPGLFGADGPPSAGPASPSASKGHGTGGPLSPSGRRTHSSVSASPKSSTYSASPIPSPPSHKMSSSSFGFEEVNLGPSALAAQQQLNASPLGTTARSSAASEQDAASAHDPVPSFALFFDPKCDTTCFKALSASPAFLGRDVPLCGKCIGHVWMDPLLVRDRFGQPINPIQHPISQQPSLSPTDGSGNSNAGPNPLPFAWLRKKHMPAYDKQQLARAQAASEQAAAEGDASAAALMFNEARGGKNFISLNVSQARSGTYHVSAETRKAQRELSTSEGKDPYTNERAWSNYWAHYSDTKEDRDLALTLQRRLQVAGAPSAEIYALDRPLGMKRSPEELEKVYGMRYVEDSEGRGRLYPITPGGKLTSPSKGGGVPQIAPTRAKSRPTSSSIGLSFPAAAISSAHGGSAAGGTPLHDRGRSSQTASPKRSRVSSAAASPTRSRVGTLRDNTFLTSVDHELDEVERPAAVQPTLVALRAEQGRDADAEAALDLAEIVQGESHELRKQRSAAAAAIAAPAAVVDPSTEENDLTSWSFSPSHSTQDEDPESDSHSAQLPTKPADYILAASSHGGSRMEQRIAEKAQRRADAEAREALAQALLASSEAGRSRHRSREDSHLLHSTFVPGHEPKVNMALIFDRSLSPPPAAANRRRSRPDNSLLSHSLRADTWSRVRQVQAERATALERARTDKLMFLRPGTSEAATAHQPLYNLPVGAPMASAEREQRALRYRDIRRSQSVAQLRASQGAEEEAERSADFGASEAASYLVGSALPSGAPSISSSLSGSRSMSASRSRVALGAHRDRIGSPHAGSAAMPDAADAYSPEKMYIIGGKGTRAPAGSGLESAAAGGQDSPSKQKRPSSSALPRSPASRFDPVKALAASRATRPLSPTATVKMASLQSVYRVPRPASAAPGSLYPVRSRVRDAIGEAEASKSTQLHVLSMPEQEVVAATRGRVGIQSPTRTGGAGVGGNTNVLKTPPSLRPAAAKQPAGKHAATRVPPSETAPAQDEQLAAEDTEEAAAMDSARGESSSEGGGTLAGEDPQAAAQLESRETNGSARVKEAHGESAATMERDEVGRAAGRECDEAAAEASATEASATEAEARPSVQQATVASASPTEAAKAADFEQDTSSAAVDVTPAEQTVTSVPEVVPSSLPPATSIPPSPALLASDPSTPPPKPTTANWTAGEVEQSSLTALTVVESAPAAAVPADATDAEQPRESLSQSLPAAEEADRESSTHDAELRD